MPSREVDKKAGEIQDHVLKSWWGEHTCPTIILIFRLKPSSQTISLYSQLKIHAL